MTHKLGILEQAYKRPPDPHHASVGDRSESTTGWPISEGTVKITTLSSDSKNNLRIEAAMSKVP